MISLIFNYLGVRGSDIYMDDTSGCTTPEGVAGKGWLGGLVTSCLATQSIQVAAQPTCITSALKLKSQSEVSQLLLSFGFLTLAFFICDMVLD